jgi:hypothetical protein
MKEDQFNELLNTLTALPDLEEPAVGHQERFLEKLNAVKGKEKEPLRRLDWWKPLSIAASIVLVLGIFLGSQLWDKGVDERITEISPEVSNTEFYFANLIEQQVAQLESESSPETRKIIDDTMLQLDQLESDYNQLKIDLLNGGNSKFILSAMIQNFQTRIDLMQDVLNQIETIKTLKIHQNENNII